VDRVSIEPSGPGNVRGVVARYAEIGLKGGNRRPFERRLADRLREALKNAGLPARVLPMQGRFVALVEDPALAERALTVLARIPGVANVAPVRVVAADLQAIEEAAAQALADAPPGSFKLEARRSDKRFPLDSIGICRRVGAACEKASGRAVDVHAPAVTVRIEVLQGSALVSGAPRAGPGGLPVGSSGRLLAFLSGGLDSPVAAWQMLRRGARVTAVHFWNRTHQGPAVREKCEDLGRILARAAGSLPLVVVPFEACQRAIVAAVPPRLRMIVYRRAMFRIGAVLARPEKALGFVTGDSLGQVASQTAENLRAIHAAATLPVYAPLIGSDKVEIVERARAIGTYDVSIRPHADCCSFLIAPHPETRCRLEAVEDVEREVPWDGLVAEAASGAERTVLLPD
jgi:thiamine biosynthesis protein ThiI